MGEALPISHDKKLGLGVALGALCVILGFSFAPKAGSNALKRWFLPLSDTECYTFTHLDLPGLPDPYTVPYAEPFVITVPLTEATDDLPATPSARYGFLDSLSTQSR